ncbi:MAG: RAD55 family ATPase [Thermoplasmata archaeon]|nr:RAD55 family ATPase [Thermoplasmata archaeon]
MAPPTDAAFPPLPPTSPASTPSIQRIPGGRKISRVPSGIPRLDDVLQGGYPANGHVLLLGAPFLGREVAVNSFLADGLRRGERVVVVTTARTPVELASEMGLILPQFKEYEQTGRVTWVDATNPTGTPTSAGGDDGHHYVVKGPGDFAGLLSTIASALVDPRAETTPTPVRVAFTHLSACLAHGEDADAFEFVNNLVSLLKTHHATTVSGIDPATVPPKRVEQLLNRVDGAILFESDAGRTWLSVRGMGDLVYRQRIEYRATTTSLVLGSLALERIR